MMTPDEIEIVLTGTGTPIPVPDRAGPGVFVRTPDALLQIDAGRSTVLRLIEAGVAPDQIDALFLTHHHSDHTTDVGDLLVSAWLVESSHVADLLAPAGLAAEFARAALAPYRADMEFRRRHRGVVSVAAPTIASFVPERTPREVWQRGDTRVDAVAVRHEPVENAVAYRIDHPAGSVVVSGDTRACTEVEQLAAGAQVLVHEAVDPARVPSTRQHTIAYHALPRQVGELAERAGVELLALTHLWPAPENDGDVHALLDEVRGGGFEGDVVIGCDLTRIVMSDARIHVRVPARAGVAGLHSPSLRRTTRTR